MAEFKVCTLNVWGNGDGYVINKHFTLVESVNINSDDDMTAFISEYLKSDPKQYDVQNDMNGFIEVSYSGKPILHFNCIDDTYQHSLCMPCLMS